MKTTTLVLMFFLTTRGLWAQTLPIPMTPAQRQLQAQLRTATNNPAGAPVSVAPATAPAISTPMPGAPAKEIPGYVYNWPGVDVNQVLEVYANLVGRTLLRANLPQASITLKTQSPLTKTEAIEALQAVLALNGIVVVPIGEKFVKVLPPDQAGTAGAELNNIEASQLPDLGTYVTHITQLKYVKPSVIIPLIQSFGKLQGNLFAIDDNGILVMRDYAENVKRMLEMIDKIDISVPAVFISEVIPIRYAKADDIASALNSLGGSGGATVSVGSSASAAPISGVAPNRSATGLGGMGTTTQPGAYNNAPGSQPGQPPRTGLGAQANPNGTPSSTTPFQQRLLNIINRAPGGGSGGGGQGQIEIFGQAKIIADERANALLVFATRQDMDQIKEVISKLDVLLAQVLIESVIIDYSLGPDTLNFGVSAAQNPKNYGGGLPAVGGGGVNNGQSLLKLLGSNFSPSNNVSGFANALPGGLSYFGNIGPTWDVAVAAAAADSHASIIQRPRIQTSQAKPAQFFVGDTVPYVTGTLNYGGAYGNQSSYAQLSVGVELDVTPFINPDGLVVMQIQQEIDELNGTTTIAGVGDIPNTIKRTLNSEIAVRDKDTVMLGGFIKNKKSTSRAGVPVLMNIPLLGNLFTKRNDSKQREELIVLMRPTVLKTPELAAANTIAEGRRLPGVSKSIAENAEEESKAVEAERKLESKHPKTMSGGFFNTPMPTNAPQEQLPPPRVQSDSFFTPVAPNAPVISPDNSNPAPPTP